MPRNHTPRGPVTRTRRLTNRTSAADPTKVGEEQPGSSWNVNARERSGEEVPGHVGEGVATGVFTATPQRRKMSWPLPLASERAMPTRPRRA
jgi:hypothetical protein